jgi:ABC-2 type transport system permease protein
VSAATLAWRQFRFERRQFWRNPSAAFFNFLLPLVFLLLFASVFADDEDQLEILIPGIAAMSVMATTFSALAFNVTYLREEGILKRIRGTPLPPAAYFAGFLGSAIVNALVQVGLVVSIGNLLYGVDWPRDWLALAFFSALGVACFGSLGIALSHAIPNFDAAPAYVNAVFLPLIFISGVFYESDSLPVVLEDAANVLPLKHVVDGLAAGIVSGDGIGDELTAVAVIAAWTAFGLFAAVRWFRWE